MLSRSIAKRGAKSQEPRAKSEERRAKSKEGPSPFALSPLPLLCSASIDQTADASLSNIVQHEFGIKIDCSVSESRHKFRESLRSLAQANPGWIHRTCA